jgi:hypothetical protein
MAEGLASLVDAGFDDFMTGSLRTASKFVDYCGRARYSR